MSKSFRELVEALNSKARKKSTSAEDGHVGGKPAAKGEEDFAKDMYPVKTGGETDRPSSGKDADDILNARGRKQAMSGEAGEKTAPDQGSSGVKAPFGFKGTQTPPNRGDNRQGDKTQVKLSPSAVKTVREGTAPDTNLDAAKRAFKRMEPRLKRFMDVAHKRGEASKKAGYRETSRKEGPGGTLTTGVYVKEDVLTQLGKISRKTADSNSVKFLDGDTADVTPETAKRVLKAYGKLSSMNAQHAAKLLNKSPAEFLKMMNFLSKRGD